MKKVVCFFRKKIGVTPSVAAPGVTHPSDDNVKQSLRLHPSGRGKVEAAGAATEARRDQGKTARENSQF